MKLTAVAIAVTLAATCAVHAQMWPTKSLRVVVPFTAGSATDTTARVVVERLSTQLGQTFVIENRPGAGGAIGANLVAKATPPLALLADAWKDQVPVVALQLVR